MAEKNYCGVCDCPILRLQVPGNKWLHDCHHGPFGHKSVHAPVPANIKGSNG